MYSFGLGVLVGFEEGFGWGIVCRGVWIWLIGFVGILMLVVGVEFILYFIFCCVFYFFLFMVLIVF